jgi:hypothetical protein
MLSLFMTRQVWLLFTLVHPACIYKEDSQYTCLIVTTNNHWISMNIRVFVIILCATIGASLASKHHWGTDEGIYYASINNYHGV